MKEWASTILFGLTAIVGTLLLIVLIWLIYASCNADGPFLYRKKDADEQKIIDFIRGRICTIYGLDESEIEVTVRENGVKHVDIWVTKPIESVTICGTISYDLEDENGN